jgi:hypothetical protein
MGLGAALPVLRSAPRSRGLLAPMQEFQAMTKQACCSSPAAMCYWFLVSLMAWGSAEPHRDLMAPSPRVVSGCVPFRHGHRLPRQLAEESLFSLCDYWPFISDRWPRVPALGRAHDPHQHPLGLALRPHRHRHRVSAGMAICKAGKSRTDRLFWSEEEEQHKPAKVIRQALLKIEAYQAHDQAQQRQRFAQNVGRKVAGLPVAQSEWILGV